jgi:small basic protein
MTAPFLLIGLVAGAVAGWLLPGGLPVAMARYHSVALLAALDSVFGGLVAGRRGQFHLGIFVTGFVGNAILAAALTYIGDRTGVELYLAAVFALGTRIFLNLGTLRRSLFGFGGDARPLSPPARPE